MVSKPLSPILVAEDDPNDLFLVQRCFSRAGITNPVLTFTNGEDLIEYLRGDRPRDRKGEPAPRLLFLDIKMPRCDGFDVLRWIRRQDNLKGLTVVILSGSDEPRDIKRAQELGALRFLTKYPSPDVFAEIVASVT